MWLSEEEQLVIRYIQNCGEAGASAREVCRKASTKEQWKENERWAYPVLSRLRDKSVIDTNAAGNYQLVNSGEGPASDKPGK